MDDKQHKSLMDKLKDLEMKLEAKTGVDLPTPFYVFIGLVLLLQVFSALGISG